MSKRGLLLLLVLIAAALTACGPGPSPRQSHLPREVDLLVDRGGKMDISQAASPQEAGGYTRQAGNRMSLGFCRSALWVRLPLDQTPAQGCWVLSVAAPWMDQVDLYLPRPNGGWEHLFSGLQQPNGHHGAGGFALIAPEDTPRAGYGYLRLQSVLSLNAGLRIWPDSEFMRDAVNHGYLYGVLYGVLGAMFLVNLMVLVSTRDRAYLLYVLYLAAIMSHQMCLQGQVLYLPFAVWPMVPEISLLVSSGLFFFGAAFCRVFLNTKLHTPLVDWLLKGAQAAAVLLLLLGLIHQIWLGTWLVHILAILGPVLGIVAGIKVLSQGFRPARFYLVAWVVLLLGSMAWGAWSMGWQFLVPLPRSLLTMAAALESVLLSLALADRVRVMQLERKVLALRERRYHHLSITDDLTGLFNARYFWSKLDSEIAHAHDLDQPLGLVILDVDDFKLFNDSYGHPEGDKVLTELGRLMRLTVRPADSACRYGGEEFALLLPGATGKAAWEVAERIRAALSRVVFQPGSGARVMVTVSLGTAQLRSEDSARSLVSRADQALYRAKALGKNQTISSDDNGESSSS
ncbi:MAG: sensor domain-containing diguanylate cyclase [Desulfarculaceae bacterium]|nr:sensor domain-containing diguanylate cyclase [Desulfarculaceae bacterium]MCF8072143.1 sensor domain-containing diguanylate cyclase [Desulfarculaceae bacterium]MCF8100064.1 sensor domain-containing diguanylate cyclase [Desulfarculaceae bacterium]MCF8118271.1 sensor domain-containing diguanylate cyclase [Desulfarculaceae bacterium]